jgi:hypothetical protein
MLSICHALPEEVGANPITNVNSNLGILGI